MLAASKGETGKWLPSTAFPIHHTSWNTDLVILTLIANQQRSVPGKYITKGGTDVSDSIREYIEPLIQGNIHHNIKTVFHPIFVFNYLK